ncbi:ABC transporter ATP-binding protein [Virgibacillus halophilus]|uniref:ABC transporter ATP-binding protein n=1 Tax=Tigheibacillus halophilus TaxID=361280 RepID=A0ABU5C7H4_9BACI|nr:ABC transporter ATP-binding protein [Virgibacillus halophilus]
MIKITDLSHSFVLGKKNHQTSIPILQNISFEVERGKIVTIVGKSGSGKSTLLNLISGFIHPTAGQIWIDGEETTAFNEIQFADFRLEHMGFIFQTFQLISSMTAFENVELPLTLKGIKETERRERVLQLLDKVGLADFRDYYPGELSGGQQQRVSIARAMVLHPPLILADEPTGSLDSETEADLLQLIKKLNRQEGITFLIITHDESVAKIGHQTITIHDGHLLQRSYI